MAGSGRREGWGESIEGLSIYGAILVVATT